MESIVVPKIIGSQQPPDETTSLFYEAMNLIQNAGITLSGADVAQFGKAVANYSVLGQCFTDSGVANAYVLSAQGSMKAPSAYINNMKIRFTPQATNTTSSTLNLATLGVKNIKYRSSGNDLSPKQMVAGYECTLVYNLSDDVFYLLDNGISYGATPTPATITSSVTLTLAQLNASYLVDCTAGNVDIQLPLLSTVPNGTWVKFIRIDTAEQATLYRMKIYGGNSGADLINTYNDHYFYFAETGGQIEVFKSTWKFTSIIDSSEYTYVLNDAVQSFSANTVTTIQYNSVQNGLFFNNSNWKFTPLIRGLYSCSQNILWSSTVTSPESSSVGWLYNSDIIAGQNTSSGNFDAVNNDCQSFAFNGETDFILMRAEQSSGSSRNTQLAATGYGSLFKASMLSRAI